MIVWFQQQNYAKEMLYILYIEKLSTTKKDEIVNNEKEKLETFFYLIIISCVGIARNKFS